MRNLATAACVAVVLVWLASLRWELIIRLPRNSRIANWASPDGTPCLIVGGGLVFEVELASQWPAGAARFVVATVKPARRLDAAFVLPEFSPFYGILIPLWLPLGCLAVPTALLWWRDLRPPRTRDEATEFSRVRRLFLPWPLCAVGAIPVFVAVLFVVPSLLDAASNLVADDDFHLIMRTRLGAPEMLADGVFLFLIITPAFLTAQFAYRRLHWRMVRVPATPHCKNCGYSLIGNVSGICPECGTPATPIATVDTTRSSG